MRRRLSLSVGGRRSEANHTRRRNRCEKLGARNKEKATGACVRGHPSVYLPRVASAFSVGAAAKPTSRAAEPPRLVAPPDL